ncbi:MAG TPA: hypothetical protein ENJ37_09870 [Deltaproteobacteria bacterium]|nr:hypothetical protein [Deltaproteobacteria bacterium]
MVRSLIISSALLYAAALVTVLLHHLRGGPRLERSSRLALTAGLAVHTAALGLRSWEGGHAPMASMFETLLFYSWSTVLVSAVVVYRYSERYTELITLPVALLALFFAAANETPARPLTLVLRTRWFETHVTASFAAYAFFTLAFAGAVLYLVFGRFHFGGGERERLRRDFQEIARSAVLWGFFFFSASMFAGAVWAYLAWGTYWLWEPKVIWSFIVWFYYAGAMHAWYVARWRGTGLAVATVVGFFVVLFTYLGVSLLMKSSHSF